MKKLKHHILPIIAIFSITFFTFRDLPRAFFEQDEWHSFGYYIYLQSLSGYEFLGNVLRTGPFSHFTPLSLFSKMTMYQLFGLDASKFFLVSIFLHALVSIMVYFLLILLVAKRPPALVGALFFALNSTHHQAVTWLGTFDGVLGATLFGLLSIIAFFVHREKKQRIFLYATVIFLLVSLLFKEIALSFAIFLGLVIFSFRGEVRKKLFLLLGATVSLYFLLKFSYLLFGIESLLPSPGQSDTKGIGGSLLYNLLLVPKLFSQIIIPKYFLGTLSEKITDYFKESLSEVPAPWANINELAYDVVSVLVGLFLLTFFIILIFVKKREWKTVYYGMALVILTILPLLLLRKFLVFLDSRFFYPGTVGVSIIFGALLSSFSTGNKKSSLPREFTVVILFAIIFLAHFTTLTQTINEKVKLGQEKQAILQQIRKLYPTLPNKAIIFAESDKTFYGLQKRIFPFQSGLGQILLVLYRQDQELPGGFFTSEFLWDITSEGYKELDNFSFGFFWDIDKLAKLVGTKISLDDIYGIAYDSDNNKVLDITDRVRGEILGLKAKRQELSLAGAKVNVSHNKLQAYLALDGKRDTFWSSRTPYAIKTQYFELDFKKEVELVQIRLDSFDNKNQNEVGYAVYLSENGKDWKEVLRAKRRPPRQDGIVDIYLPKVKTRFVRVEQIGYHAYAPWVIHELKIYAALD